MAQVLDLPVYQLANTVSNSVHVCNAGLIEQTLRWCTVSLVDEPFKKIHAFDSGWAWGRRVHNLTDYDYSSIYFAIRYALVDQT